MYGEPLEPRKALFHISTPEEFAEEQGDDEEYVVSMFVVDMDEPDNDNVRDVKHPDFDRYWGNMMENCFEVYDEGEDWSYEKALEWCLSIGMVQADNNICCDEKYVAKYRK
jgi:hypothetical protein